MVPVGAKVRAEEKRFQLGDALLQAPVLWVSGGHPCGRGGTALAEAGRLCHDVCLRKQGPYICISCINPTCPSDA